MTGFQPFRLNVGFIAAADIGYRRQFVFEDLAFVRLEDLELREVHGSVTVLRTPQGLLFQVDLRATTPQVCVRCLKPIQQPVHAVFEELYAFSEKHLTESGLLYPASGVVDLSPLVREFMILDIPFNPLCSPECKGLCPQCGANLNEENCGHQKRSIDPRWAALQALLSPASEE